MNWLQKVAVPIRITPEMHRFSQECYVALYGKYNAGKLEYNREFFTSELKVDNWTIPVSVTIKPPEPGRGLASAETPSWWEHENKPDDWERAWELAECNITIYETMPPENDQRVIERAILHELVHCVDPKLDESRSKDRMLFDSPWHRREREKLRDPNYVDSPSHYTAPWEQDAFMSSKAYDQVAMWHRNEVTRERAIEELHLHMADDSVEREYRKDDKLWRRYMRAMAEAFNSIYDNPEYAGSL